MKKLGLLIFFVFLGCTTPQKKSQPAKASPDAQREFQRIQIELASGSTRKAIPRLNKFINQHPGTDIADDATLLLANAQFNNRNYDAAYSSYMSLVNSKNLNANEGEALLGAARCLTKTGRPDEAISLTEKSIRIPNLNSKTLIENYRLRFQLFSEMNDRVDALKAAVVLAERETDLSVRDSYRLRAIDLIESRLNEKEVTSIANSDFGWLRAYAYFRLGMIAVDERDHAKARSAFARVIELQPTGELNERARQRMDQLDARRKVESFTIGAILPLSGKYANVGARTLKGLQLGLGIYGSERSEFKLALQDEEGTADSSRRAVERLVTEDHVMAIVGSLLSRTAVNVASKSEELGVPSIGLSQKAGLTEIGPTVFRNAVTSQMQIRALVRVAMENLGIKKFAVLYPNDAYGVEYTNLLWDEVLSRGGQITAAQIYEPNETDFSSHVERLANKYYFEDREDEYKYILRDWAKKQKSLTSRKSIPEDLLPPIVEFQALFIPDGIKAVGQIAPMLAFKDVRDVKLMGTNLWNTDALITRGERHVEKSIFIDSLFAQDNEFRNSKFFRDFQKVFNEEPGLFELLGYDTGLILKQLILSGERSRGALAEKLANLKNFPGGVSSLSMNDRREIQRPLVALTVQSGKIVQLTR